MSNALLLCAVQPDTAIKAASPSKRLYESEDILDLVYILYSGEEARRPLTTPTVIWFLRSADIINPSGSHSFPIFLEDL
jgi:hypothetical protein